MQEKQEHTELSSVLGRDFNWTYFLRMYISGGTSSYFTSVSGARVLLQSWRETGGEKGREGERKRMHL